MQTFGEITAQDYEIHGNPFDFDPNEGRDLPSAPATVPAPRPNGATEKQINFLHKLLVERGLFVSDEEIAKLSKSEASKRISELLDMPKIPRAAATAKPAVEITDGMYRVPDSGEIFKVQRAVHGSGHLYAKRLVVEQDAVRDESGKVVTPAVTYFEYAAGAIRRLRPEWKMSLEEAKAFGALYGTCCVCSRTLTKEESIDAGIGPICASKF